MKILKIFKVDRETYKRNTGYKALSDFIDKINFSEVKNGDILLEQARINFETIKNSLEHIEKKADDFLRYLGVGTGFLGILLNYSAKPRADIMSFFTLLGFICWTCAIIFAFSIRRPSVFLCPSPFDKALLFMAKYSDEPQALRAWIASAHELAMRNHVIVGDKKASKLNIAYIFLFLALGLFFLSFVLRII